MCGGHDGIVVFGSRQDSVEHLVVFTVSWPKENKHISQMNSVRVVLWWMYHHTLLSGKIMDFILTFILTLFTFYFLCCPEFWRLPHFRYQLLWESESYLYLYLNLYGHKEIFNNNNYISFNLVHLIWTECVPLFCFFLQTKDKRSIQTGMKYCFERICLNLTRQKKAQK